jgi:hypothetical protein
MKLLVHNHKDQGFPMKKTLLLLVAVAASFGSMSQAFAYEHHRPVCHNERIHHHWVKRCH